MAYNRDASWRRGVDFGRAKEQGQAMDYWNVVWLVAMLGLAVVAPVIALVVAVRGLGVNALSEKQRRAGEEALRKAGIVRESEAWEARDLNELLLNMRRYDQWKSIGINGTILLTGGVGMIALIWAAGGMVNLLAYTTPAWGIWIGSLALGVSVGYVASDRRFAARADALAAPRVHVEGIFSGPDGAWHRPWWVLVLDAGLIAGVIVCTLLYALGRGDRLDDATTNFTVAHHPWLIWCVPVALCVNLATRELLMWWERQRSPLRLTERPELAGRADLHRRREAYKALFSDWTVLFSIPWLSMSYLMAFDGLAGFSIQFPLALAAFGAWGAGIIAHGLVESRRKRQARIAGDAGLRGGSGAV